MDQFIAEAELNAIKGLMHYLNQPNAADDSMTFEVRMIDANGDSLGSIKRGEAEYVYFPRDAT
jgi:hypothetical protein